MQFNCIKYVGSLSFAHTKLSLEDLKIFRLCRIFAKVKCEVAFERSKHIQIISISWKCIEVVITALTRNQVYGNVSWVRIPPLPPKTAYIHLGIGFLRVNFKWDSNGWAVSN